MLISKATIQQVKMNLVRIKKTGSEEKPTNTKWSRNYNGNDSYIKIPGWLGNEISFDFFLRGENREQWFFDGQESGINSYLYMNADNQLIFDDSLVSSAYLDDVPITSASATLSRGFHSIRLLTDQQFAVNYLGNKGGASQGFEGQLTNIRLTNSSGLSGSRYYRDITDDYVDPAATDVPLPSDVHLKDELGIGITDGEPFNFGTSQPFAPSLGNREEYNSNRSGGDYVRGVAIPIRVIDMGSFRLIGDDDIDKSPDIELMSNVPVNSFIEASELTIKITTHYSSNGIRWDKSVPYPDEQIQTAFQYPNVFRVIKPGDPDYGDYEKRYGISGATK